jgi:hypothetical protein
MCHYLHIIKNKKFNNLIKKSAASLLSVIFFINLNASANPLRPTQKSPEAEKKEDIEFKKNPPELVKWPRSNRYQLGFVFSNSRIDGFQIQNNTKGTLVSETNMGVEFQFFNWLKRDYDFSVGLNIENIKMRDEASLVPIDNESVMALGFNVMGRWLLSDNLYIKAIIGEQNKIFYSPNATLTGYEIQKPFVPFLGGGASILILEVKKIKIGTEGMIYFYSGTSAGSYSVSGGQGYDIRLFSLWPRGSNQLIPGIFYHSRIQNTDIIRTQEQKIGFDIKYQY